MSSNCSNCYNGCTEIVSDKCVKYTGVDVPILEIQKGDSLSYVEQALITFLTATLNGSGITITIDEADYCEVVSQYLQECETVTALDLFKALVKAACDIQTQIDAIDATITTLNGTYTIECLDGVTTNSDTHDIVQAVITKLCEVDTTLTALAADIDTNYVKLSDLNALIEAYIDSTTASTRYSSKMIPGVALEYHSTDLTGFDITGAGIVGSVWEDIYLCNGNNGTPDKRGRSPIGAIVNMGGGVMDAEVDPAFTGNTNYTLLGVTSKNGTNTVTLDATQIPSHTHVATVTDPGHTHDAYAGGDFAIWTNNEANAGSGSSGYEVEPINHHPTTASSGVDGTDISVANANAGGGLAHLNVHPVLACYYIIYLP